MKIGHPFRSALFVFGLALVAMRAHSQAISEDQVKAAYLYNFAKFVQWPENTFLDASTPIHLCVLNDPPIESELSQMVKGKRIRGRAVAVVPIQNGEQGRGCQILFIDSEQSSQIDHIIKVLQGASVLTVGETTGFVEEGGIVNFVLQNDEVHFQVNQRAAIQSKIRVSSRLLSVAKRVIE